METKIKFPKLLLLMSLMIGSPIQITMPRSSFMIVMV